MMLAIAEAERGEGNTAPNPPVGAVLVKDGVRIGGGFHRAAGMPHAEVEAFKACESSAEGATLYVTLEPCSTHGRTPPCTERILREKVAKVVIGTLDPNPRHAGRGVEILRAAGIDVTVMECEACRDLVAPFRRWITTGLPFVTLKIAQTRDGFIGREGEGRRHPVAISCEASRERVHALRRRVDAIMVGVGTVIADNPRLLPVGADLCVRPDLGTHTGAGEGGHIGPPLRQNTRPWRLIVDSHGRTSLDANVCTDAARARTIIAVAEHCPEARRRALEAAGVTVWVLPSDTQGRVDIAALVETMGKIPWLHVLCEGGATLAASLIRGGHVDALHLITAPWEMGSGVPAFDGIDIASAFHWRPAFPVGTDTWRTSIVF
ncbi:MAG: bifunctional diaminohydroxyphosphoribosylaminopyrimidine deaminase/5-amino-6-(5-phosphoribosylamino)uracil reductase RibD [Kiritimatiellaeota bacterium]|nr:bifunctional diaminohydroxyphosphoribosylaminopyrimidine deaminase/5-amino-6-(5-phosphoribosylamino)uracil reductase RibD [Kiritimatiellota bacterium]